MAIILASQSPRRRELLGQMGLSFTVRVADIDEAMDPRLPPEEAVAAVSAKKASAVPAEADDVVIAADTIVVLDDTILGKPRTPEEAEAMLLSLSGRTHRVMTGVTVCQNGRVHSFTEITHSGKKSRHSHIVACHINRCFAICFLNVCTCIIAKKPGLSWVNNFIMAGSMIIGMVSALLWTAIF